MFSYQVKSRLLAGDWILCEIYMWFARCFWIVYLNWEHFLFLNSFFVPHLYFANLAILKYRLGLIKRLLWPSFTLPVLFVGLSFEARYWLHWARWFYLNKDWGCVILREIDFLLKICWSIPCLHPSWKVHTWIEARWYDNMHQWYVTFLLDN